MATGDTIPGSVVVARVDDTGNQTVVVGPINVQTVDTKDATPENKVFLNTMHARRATKPAGAQSRSAPDAQFLPGEKIKIGAIPSESVSNPVDASSYVNVAYLERDMNRGTVNAKDFGAAMNQNTTDRSLVAGEPTFFFEDTIGSEKEVRLAGVFELDPVEA